MACKAKLMIPEDDKYQGKVLALSHPRTAITTIKAKFSRQQLQRFEGSCFGHLLLIEDLNWTAQIFHGLLMRKAHPKSVKQVNGIKFIVGNKLIQFTAQHFCLITGLRFGKLPFIPKVTNENCSLKRKYFSTNKPATVSDLHNAFIDCIDDEDVVKLGMVYFAVFVLLGTEKHVNIDMRYLKLAEDLEEFDKYPWGAVSYAMTNNSLLRAICSDYQRVKVPQKRKITKKSGTRAHTRMPSARPREYTIKGFGFALQIWAFEVFPALEALHFVVHEDNRHIPRILHWRTNTVARFRDLMSQVYENVEVDVQLHQPTDIEKKQPYWSWGDAENNEEIVELFGDEAEQNTSSSNEAANKEVEDTVPFPHLLSKDELAKLRTSNRGPRNRVRELEGIVDKNYLKQEDCEKNKKAIRDLTRTIASIEHYLKMEMKDLKKQYGGEADEEVSTPHMNERGQNDMSRLNEPISPTTTEAELEAEVYGDGVEAFPAMHTQGAQTEAEVNGDEVETFPAMHTEGAEMEQEVPGDRVGAFPAMEVEGTKIETSVGDKQVQQQPDKVPTSEDVKDWKKTEIEAVGGKLRARKKTKLTVASDEGNKKVTATVQKQDAGGKGCRVQQPTTTLLSPFTDPYRKKRTLTDLDAPIPEARFDPRKLMAMDDVNAVIQVCRAWQSDIKLGF
ncbi:unnamed protein product [Prunus armeniaca]